MVTGMYRHRQERNKWLQFRPRLHHMITCTWLLHLHIMLQLLNIKLQILHIRHQLLHIMPQFRSIMPQPYKPASAYKPSPVFKPAPAFKPTPAYKSAPAIKPAPVQVFKTSSPYEEPAAVPAKYSYEYAVADDYSKSAFQATENRAGYSTAGEYRVSLPDGRTQIVTYTVADTVTTSEQADIRAEV